MMRVFAVLLILLALLAPVFALAQDVNGAPPAQRQLACLPGYVLPDWPDAKATPLMQGRIDGIAGEWSQIWCPVLVPETASIVYRNSHIAVLDKYRVGPAALIAGILQVARSATPLAEAQQLLNGGAVLPPPNTFDRWQFDTLHAAACRQGLALPPEDADVSRLTCPAAPHRPYVVKANAAAVDRPVYPFANGVRGTVAIPGARAVVRERCDQTVAQAPGTGADLYLAFGPTFDPSRVTLCSPAP